MRIDKAGNTLAPGDLVRCWNVEHPNSGDKTHLGMVIKSWPRGDKVHIPFSILIDYNGQLSSYGFFANELLKIA